MVMEPFVLFVDLFSEGKRTEPDYLEKFVDVYAKGKVKINTVVRGESLHKLINYAITHSAQHAEKRFNKGIICIVADKDKLTDADIKNAIAKVQHHNQRCKTEHQKINLYISNPCIEVWALAHFMDKKFPATAHACQSELKRFLPKYDHDGGMALFDLKIMTEDKYQKAKRLVKAWRASVGDDPNQFPYTDIVELLERIKQANA